MTRRAASLAALCLLCLIGCGPRTLDLDHAAPDASVPMGTPDPVVSGVKLTGVWAAEPRLYWSTLSTVNDILSERLNSCRTDDCGNTKVSYPQATKLFRAAIAEGRVYWTSGSSIFSCTEGCEGKPIKVTEDPSLAWPISAYRDYVYWSSDFDLYRCQAQGCAEPPEVVASNGSSEYLAFAGDRVYWTEPYRIMSAPIDGSDLPQLVAEVTLAKSLAIRNGYLYWAESTKVFRCPIANCDSATELLVTASNPVYDFKVDDSAIYWLDFYEIHSCPITGCEQPTLLAQNVAEGLIKTARFAIDASYVYWLESDAMSEPNGKSLRRIPK